MCCSGVLMKWWRMGDERWEMSYELPRRVDNGRKWKWWAGGSGKRRWKVEDVKKNWPVCLWFTAVTRRPHKDTDSNSYVEIIYCGLQRSTFSRPFIFICYLFQSRMISSEMDHTHTTSHLPLCNTYNLCCHYFIGNNKGRTIHQLFSSLRW